MQFMHVVGTRPNYIKLCPLLKSMQQKGLDSLVVHTGQHYDYSMSEVFFRDLEIPKPDFYLNAGSGSHAAQTANLMIKCEEVFLKSKPDYVIVYGDVNSTVAAALVASKIGIPIIHIEAGCRSFDRSMPEEINRVITDHISDYFFCIDDDSVSHLIKEGITENVFLSGNLMIDCLVSVVNRIQPDLGDYTVLTLHRPSNTDNEENLRQLLSKIDSFGRPIVFPAHPRIVGKLQNMRFENIKVIEPQGYVDFVKLLAGCEFVITDSGGIQCEASVLNKTCFTLRNTTEHALTTTCGTNTLCSVDGIDFRQKPLKSMPDAWDGKASERISEILCKIKN